MSANPPARADLLKDLRQRVRFRLAISPAAHRVRELTNARRMEPSFFLIGAQKAGTTFLHSLLSQHPDVQEPWRKEVSYYSFFYWRGASWYRAHFPTQVGNPRAITGESSTNYIFHPLAAERIARDYPNAKIIAVLRDPVSRAVSHYQMNIARNHETLPFAEAIAREGERLKGEFERVEADPTYLPDSFRYHSYQRRGMYREQLDRYERLFPKENILVFDSRRLFKTPEEVLVETERFLGLSEWVPKRFTPENVAKVKADADEATLKAMREAFRPHNEALFAHLGWSNPW